ncbi:MAG: tetratricopeptide repeat protein [Planctomycetota bacterium]|jgi:tetratricopeptide (TPR) repeat protein
MALAPVKTGVRGSFAIFLWILAVIPPLILLIDASSPIRADQLAHLAATALIMLGWFCLGSGLFTVLTYPPLVPGLRLWLRRLRTRMSIDQGPILAARGRLKHLETADDHLLIALSTFDMGNLRAAMPHLLRAIELDGENLKARYYLARCYRHLGQIPLALDQLSFVVQREEGHAFGRAVLEFAVCLERVHQDAPALEALDRFEQIAGANRESSLLRARLLRSQERHDESLAVLRQAARAPEPGKPFPLEESLARAKARFALWRGGRI